MRSTLMKGRCSGSSENMLDQVVFADHPLTIANDKLQQIKNLRLHVDPIGPTPQFLTTDVEGKVFELVDQPNCPSETGL